METIFSETALLPQGWARDVRVSIGADGRIESVEPDAIDGGCARVEILLPALSNLHSHTFQRAMAGLAERRSPAGRDSFWTWREVMYRFLDILSPDEVEAIAAFAFMEMQEAGFAAVAEFHYLHHQPGGGHYEDLAELAGRMVSAAQDTGIGLTLLPVHYSQGGVDGRSLTGGQLRFGNELAGFCRLLEQAERHVSALPPDAAAGVAPHSLRAVGAGDLKRLAELRPHAPLHMHIAEQAAEVEETLAVFGARPVTWLLDNFQVDSRWCLIHATHMTVEETERLAGSGSVAGLCPLTEANLGDGIFDGARFVGAGGRLGIGSDSNIRISVAEELRQLEYSQRLRDQARVVLASHGQSSGRFVYESALTGGAQALGRATGAIAAGNWADLVALDRRAGALEHFTGDAILDAWIFAGGNQAVCDLWAAGRHMVRESRHVRREAIANRYRACLASIMGRL